MNKKHIILYVPGLGDHRLSMRQHGLNTWKYPNVSTELVPKKWRVDETWDSKLARLINKIDDYNSQGYAVSLVGESAGATAVLAALEERTNAINAVILLCGKSQYPGRVASRLYQNNPALRAAMIRSHKVVDALTSKQKQKILNLHPVFDPIVPVWETKIPGVKNATMPIAGHFLGIAFGLTFWSFRIVRFAKQRARAQ